MTRQVRIGAAAGLLRASPAGIAKWRFAWVHLLCPDKRAKTGGDATRRFAKDRSMITVSHAKHRAGRLRGVSPRSSDAPG
jgi:hypothetical protein